MSRASVSSQDLDATMGFHGLKSRLTTRSRLLEDCEFLATCVHEAAWASRGAAYLCRRSEKSRRYLGLTRKPQVSQAHLEAQFERAMFRKWSSGGTIPGCGMHRLVDFQIPVSDRKKSLLGLKAIDLLAIDGSRLPIVVELKIVRDQKGADSPLLAILEAASYACVLLADWTQFRLELDEATEELRLGHPLPEKLARVPLVVAGSTEYWTFWNYAVRTSVVRAKPGFRLLVDAFEKEGLPISFVCVDGSPDVPETLTLSEAPFLG